MKQVDELFKRHFKFDPMYSLALLKVSNELRPRSPANSSGFERILEDTLTDFNIDRQTFDEYVDDHKNQLIQTCHRMGL
jgi:hypothetical protein